MAPKSTSAAAQAELFAEPQEFAIPGLRYQTNFLSAAEELALLETIRSLDLKEAQYRQWHAKRRTVSFGGKYDFTALELVPAEPIPLFLLALRARIGAWSGIDAAQFNHGIIAEYRTGTGLHACVFARIRRTSVGAKLHSRSISSRDRFTPCRQWRAGTGSTQSRPRRRYATRSRCVLWRPGIHGTTSKVAP